MIFKDEKEFNRWTNHSNKQTIDDIRRMFDMPSLSEKKFNCSKCGVKYPAQTENGRRRTFYCKDCHRIIRELDHVLA